MFVSVELDDGRHGSITAFTAWTNTPKNDGCVKYESSLWDELRGRYTTRCMWEIPFEDGCCACHTASDWESDKVLTRYSVHQAGRCMISTVRLIIKCRGMKCEGVWSVFGQLSVTRREGLLCP